MSGDEAEIVGLELMATLKDAMRVCAPGAAHRGISTDPGARRGTSVDGEHPAHRGTWDVAGGPKKEATKLFLFCVCVCGTRRSR